MHLLHESSPGFYWLDHRIVPEIRAMLAAMVSRQPSGGIRQRYLEVVSAIAKAEGLHFDPDPLSDPQANMAAEFRLTTYPLPARALDFMRKWVDDYGHASILEQPGGANVYVEGISRETAWRLFDSPLAIGQEMSTRAVVHSGAICREVEFMRARTQDLLITKVHQPWMEVYNQALDFWNDQFSREDIRARFGVANKEPFSAALDRARVFLPNTIAVAASFASHARDRARVLNTVQADEERGFVDRSFSGHWEAHRNLYRNALPGFAKTFGNKTVPVPAYFADRWMLMSGGVPLQPPHRAPHFEIAENGVGYTYDMPYKLDPGEMGYVDPHFKRIAVTWWDEGSLAALTDFHRHRPGFPWRFSVQSGSVPDEYKNPLPVRLRLRIDEIEKGYSYEFGSVPRFYSLPLGATVRWTVSMTLPDMVYMLRLRAESHGANFEYKRIAKTAGRRLHQLLKQVPGVVLKAHTGFPRED